MKEWLSETHGPGFELLRHFLRRFFDSDIVMSQDHTVGVLVGFMPVLFQWFLLFVGPLREKYAYLNHLATSAPYRDAVRADELCLISLMMSAIGLLTVVKWQSLFPDARDYRALGSLPLRPRDIFGAKLLAVLLVAAAALALVNFLPGVTFPALTGSRWAIRPSLAARIVAHTEASVAGCAFLFFALIAIQGSLLNLFRPHAFGRVTGPLQGCLAALMLCCVVGSFSIDSRIVDAALRPQFSVWLPPVWFLGLYQARIGDTNPAMAALAQRALAGLAAAVALALATYLTSYRRHRALFAAGAGRRAGASHWGALAACAFGDPRGQGVVVFMSQTLARGSRHRAMAMGYAALGFALLVTGIADMPHFFEPSRVVAADFVFFHMLALVLLLLGAWQIFDIPIELSANWIFRIVESQGRAEWLRAVDRFVLLWCALPLLALPLPFEIRLLGWRGAGEAALFTMSGLLAWEWLFRAPEKLPFTCSHLPGRAPIWAILAFFGFLSALAVVHGLLVATLFSPPAFVATFAATVAIWLPVHRNRRRGWASERLIYEEVPDPAVHALNLLR